MNRTFQARSGALIAFALFAAGSLCAQAAKSAPAPATSVEQLRQQIQAIVDAPDYRAALWGVDVVSLDTGRTLFVHHADRRMSPASNSKLYTAALALDRFGGDYRILTPIFSGAPVASDGVLAGDLVVCGRGDPSWKSDPKHPDFWKIFEPFVDVVKKAGVRRITGEIVGDATYFRMLPNGAGWTADDLNDYYGAEISALTLEDNYAQLRISPAEAIGQPARLALVQPGTGLLLDNRVTTIAKDGARRISAQRLIGENVVHVFGAMPAGAPAFTEDVTMPRPASWFAEALREALVRAGIVVDGKPHGVRWPERSAGSEHAVKLGEISSPPLRQLVHDFLKPSQNLETDLIFAHVGESTRTASTPPLRTSEQLGVAALQDFLEQNKLPADDVHFEEGAGLSRNNLTTAQATVALLRFMSAHRDGAAFRDGLPIAGVDGTLRRRMLGTAAQGNVRAKTGTLRYAISLSGYVTSAAGEHLVFSVMLNRAVSAPGRNARDDVDAIAVMLAQLAAKSEVAGAN